MHNPLPVPGCARAAPFLSECSSPPGHPDCRFWLEPVCASKSPCPLFPRKQDFADITMIKSDDGHCTRRKIQWFILPQELNSKGANWHSQKSLGFGGLQSWFESLPHYLITHNNDRYYLLRVYAGSGAYVISFHLHNYPMKQVLLYSPIYRWRNWGTERWRNLPKVTQLATGWEGTGQVQTQVVWLHRMCEHEQVLSSLTLSFLI